MVNVLIPMAGPNLFFSEAEFPFPKPLIEIRGKTMIEHVVENFSSLAVPHRFVFVVRSSDCRKYHLDSTLSLITNNQCRIVRLDSETQGAACSALMATPLIGNQTSLIISNFDQLFDQSLNKLIFEFHDADAGVVTFDSVHPRWSYVRLDEDGFVIETAEKRPISRRAIAGLYYFRHGFDFVEAAMRTIRKGSSVNGHFYIAPTLNELILEGKKIRAKAADNGRYHTFYTPRKIEEFELKIAEPTHDL